MNRKEQKALYQSFFKSKGWKPLAFQNECLREIQAGQNGLLNVPTGSGKTYALMLPIFLESMRTNTKGITAIWITPLRALAKEIHNSAMELNAFFDLGWNVAHRTGDTSTSERQKQFRKPPKILITTPESLMLLLARKKHLDFFKGLQYIVADEWHELIGTKRAVQVELALSHLKRQLPEIKIWGISATIGNLEEAQQVLFGSDYKEAVLVRSTIKKDIQVKSIFPDEVEKYPWGGHLGTKLAHKVLPIIDSSKSTLLFTNTRAQAEIWYQELLKIAPELAGLIAMHHGSMDRELRDWVEQSLHDGKLKAVVCTSSLDLGVDFRPVDTIIQIGSAKSVARFIQRAGRSGHQPKAKSTIYFLPTHSLELMEASALREAIQHQELEPRLPYFKSFDVLVQYLVTLAVGDGFYPKAILQEITSTFSYQSITSEEWHWCLQYITKGGTSLAAYEEFEKVEIIDGLYTVTNRRIAMRHRLSIGTIVSDAVLQVKYMKGSRIGTIEEWFISKLQPGEIFWLSGKNLELVRIKENTVYVRKAKAKQGKIPSWQGGRMPLSSELSGSFRHQLTQAAENASDHKELKVLQPLLERQKQVSVIPKEDELLLESFSSREGNHLVVYPFEGRFVHEAMASVLAYRCSLLEPISFSIAFTDYGFELLSDKEIPVQEMLDNDFFSSEHLFEHLQSGLNATEMARRKFRDIAAISGLITNGLPGKSPTEKHLRASSKLFFDVFRDYEPDSLLYQQAYKEVFEFQLEEARLRKALDRIQHQKIIWIKAEKATPFAFPIIVDRLREKLSSEKLADRVKRMSLQLEK